MVECITVTPNLLGKYWENPAYRPIVDDSLVLWLTSDFGNGETWTDLSGNNNHGTIHGATRTPIHPLDIFGSALELESTYNQVVDCGRNASLYTPDAITIDTCVKPASLMRYGGIVSTDWTQPYSLLHVNNHLYFYLRSGGVIHSARISSWLDATKLNKWWYISARWSKDVDGGKLKIFANNEELSYAVQDSLTTSLDNLSRNLYIGMHGENYYDGTNARVIIYNRALSMSEGTYNYTHSPIYYMQREL